MKKNNKDSANNSDAIVFMGTYPPRECGIGTFTYDLRQACQTLTGNMIDYPVAAMNISINETFEYPEEVFWQLDENDPEDYKRLVIEINKSEKIKGIVVQHEYGIYGEENGKNLLETLKFCKKPKVLCLHTVLSNPDEKIKRLTSELFKNATCVVVLTETSKKILSKHFPEVSKKICVIEHGIHPVLFSLPEKNKARLRLANKKVLTTFGLLSRGKGIEYVIQALPEVINKHPDLVYLVLGQTHPVMRRKEGEQYRLELIKLLKKLKLSQHVKFIDRYLKLEDVLKYLLATDIYISTSTNPDQAVSGTLSYALGTGRAVVTTEFKQSQEVVDEELGIIVPIKNSKAYSRAILKLLENPKKLASIHRKAYAKTRSMLYTNVAHEYLLIFQKNIIDFKNNPLFPVIKIKHLNTLTDENGIVQFAEEAVPNLKFGYTLDDNARALLVVNKLLESNNRATFERLQTKYLKFIGKCFLEDGTFINYLNKSLMITSQNFEEDLEDVYGRAMWALMETSSNDFASVKKKRVASATWAMALPQMKKISHLRARSFCIKALSKSEDLELITLHADALVESYKTNSTKDWKWFEDRLTYCNAVIPEALFLAAEKTGNQKYSEVAESTLNFLIKKTFLGSVYVPIGQKGWHKRRGARSEFDQQPEDPGTMVLALCTAFNITRQKRYLDLALKCFSWFLGNNLLGQPLYNFNNGGCYDALTKNGANFNQGAESLVLYMLARLYLRETFNRFHGENRNNQSVSK